MKYRNTYSVSEEVFNTTTHAIGIAMGLVVCIYFLVVGYRLDSPLAIFSLSLYLFGVVSSYATSTIYHAIPASKAKAKSIARKFDHVAIFWHIAGSYSPITLIAMNERGEPVWAWVIFSVVWLSAIVGTSLGFRKMKNLNYLN